MRVVDLFCGAGGFSCGAARAGCHVVLGVDSDDAMVRLWRGNHGAADGRVATLWTDVAQVPMPPPAADLHVHMSPPCTALSNAGHKSGEEVDEGLLLLRACFTFVQERGDASWSFENVSTPTTRAALDALVRQRPNDVAYAAVDAYDHGVPSSRVRLVAGPPALVRELQRAPVERVSVEAAFAARGLPLPAQHLRNTARTKARARCVRAVSGAAHTVTASHPLVWCERDGATVRCASIDETRVLMGFPPHWLLPTRARDAFRALGNAVPPPLAARIMRAAIDAAARRGPDTHSKEGDGVRE